MVKTLYGEAGSGAERHALKLELEESLLAIRSELTAISTAGEQDVARRNRLSLLDNALTRGLKHLGSGRKNR